MNRRPHQKVVSIEDMSEQELIEFAKVLEAEMSDDLKPCPFCGGEPFSFEDYGHSTAWEVGCSNSQCRVEPNVWEKTRDEALASWNTRTPDTGIEALTEQLEAARADAKEAEAYAEELEKELNLMKTAGIVEVSIRNPSVMEYVRHWEDRAETAEAKLAKAVEAVSLTVRADNFRETYHALPNDHNRIGDKRSRKGHAREAWLRAFRKAAKTSRATLAEIEGEKG
jgi:Lar family restriction alleviation protein